MLQALSRVILFGCALAALTFSFAQASDAPSTTDKAPVANHATTAPVTNTGQTDTKGQATSLDPAARQIETFYDALTAAMKGGSKIGFNGRYKKLEPVIKEVFNLPLMTKIAVGPTWPTISEPDQKALIAAFTRMTIANYAKNFDSFDGQKFVVDPNVQTRGEDKIVQSKMVQSDNSTVPFNYRMREADGAWKVIDIFLNGYVSELATRRSDFASTLSASGPKGLITKINNLTNKLKSDS